MENINELLKASFLNIDKPSGPTSHDVCEIIKRMLKASKTSHSGTLDPKVTGVLVIGLGKAARLLRFLPSDKEYVGVMRLHEDISEEKLKETIKEHFTGKIMQIPPIKSRVKRQERQREIYSFEVLEKNKQDVLFRVHCQAGTYIRKLIHDLGVKLGIGAHMTELRRTKAGVFDEKNSITLYKLAELKDNNELANHLIPINILAKHLQSVEVKKESLERLYHGSPLYSEYMENKEDIKKLKKDSFIALINGGQLIEVAKVVLEANKIAVPETVLN